MLKTFMVFLAFAATSAHAQTSDSLVGNWTFKDVYQAEKLDSAKRATLKMFFGDIRIHLKADSHYSAFFFKKEEGTWNYDTGSKQLILKHNKGEDKIRIIEVTGNTLVLEMKKGEGMVLQKELTD